MGATNSMRVPIDSTPVTVGGWFVPATLKLVRTFAVALAGSSVFAWSVPAPFTSV